MKKKTELHPRSKWHFVPTKIIRIPARFEKEILAFAHELDKKTYDEKGKDHGDN